MKHYQQGFVPYALGAFLIGLVGGFSTVLGPAFVADLGLDYNNTTWTTLSQALSTAACAPVLGRLGDALGRKRTLLGGIAVFLLGNLLSALAGNLFVMLVARFLVGVGTAAMAPVIMGYIVAEFPPNKLAGGFSLYMLISSASVIVGPSLGSRIIARWGWRSMLWLCVGISAAVLVAAWRTGQSDAAPPRPLVGFDWLGAAGVLLFFSLALCLPALGQNLGWLSVPFLFAAALTLPAFFFLLWAERRAAHPILPGRFLRRRSFLLGVTALFLTQGLMQANMTATIVFVRYTQPTNTLLSGYAISVLYLGMSLGAVVLGPLADRLPPKAVLLASFSLTALGAAMLLWFTALTPPWLLMASLGVLGLGLGGNGTIFMKIILSGLPPAEAAADTGTYGLFRDLAAPFGVAILVPLFTNSISSAVANRLPEAAAAVSAAHTLGLVELLAVAAGAVAVAFLPRGEKRPLSNS